MCLSLITLKHMSRIFISKSRSLFEHAKKLNHIFVTSGSTVKLCVAVFITKVQ
jgi:hypothetical protein